MAHGQTGGYGAAIHTQRIKGSLDTTVEWVTVDNQTLVRKNVTDMPTANREVAAFNHLRGRRGSEKYTIGYLGHAFRSVGETGLSAEIFLEPAEKENAGDAVKPTTPMTVRISMAVAFAEAVSFLHANGVIHRDIALRNFLFARGRWLVSDFGFARVPGCVSTECYEFVRVIQERGPHDSMAPEAITRGEVSTSTDVFMLGCTLFHLFFGLQRYAYEMMHLGFLTEGQRIAMITDMAKAGRTPNGLKEMRSDPDPIRRAVSRVIDACLDLDPARRPAAQKVVSMLRLIQMDPGMFMDLLPQEENPRKRSRTSS